MNVNRGPAGGGTSGGHHLSCSAGQSLQAPSGVAAAAAANNNNTTSAAPATTTTKTTNNASFKLEKSRQSARECRARKKLRYEYLEELVADREKAIFALQQELSQLRKICEQIDRGQVGDELKEEISSWKALLTPSDIAAAATHATPSPPTSQPQQ